MGGDARGAYWGVQHPEYMQIPRDGGVDGGVNGGGGVYCGCDQSWYSSPWRRNAGCGPVAATNLLLYYVKKHALPAPPYRNANTAEALQAMDDVFGFVRPTIMGLHTVRRFVKGMRTLARFYGARLHVEFLNVPVLGAHRPGFAQLRAFLEGAMRRDAPVAFLNLHEGEAPDLDGWHWVTIVGLEPADGADTSDDANGAEGAGDGGGTGSLWVRYYDHGVEKRTDVGVWLATTAGGGGFAYIHSGAPTANINQIA